MSKDITPAREAYARQLADEAKTLVPGMERLAEIAEELRADDLYRLLGFGTWEEFCTGYLGVSKSTANRLIAKKKAPAIAAKSKETPKSKSAGSGSVAAHPAPVSERDPLNFPSDSTEAPDSSSEDGEHDWATGPAPAVAPSSDPIPEGAEQTVGSLPAAPSGPIEDVPGSADPAFQRPLNPPELVDETCPYCGIDPNAGVPTEAEMIGLFFTHLRGFEPVDFFANMTEAQREELREFIRRMNPEKRRQGTITRPEDRAKAKATEAPAVKVERPLVSLPTTQSLVRREVAPMFKVAKAK